MYHPSALTFAEENTSWPKLTLPIEEGGLGFDYKWNMGWMNDTLHYMSLDPLWRPFNHDNLTFSFFYAFQRDSFFLFLTMKSLTAKARLSAKCRVTMTASLQA